MPDEASTAGYQSPFAWRYGSDAMRALWSEGTEAVLARHIGA